MGINNPSNMRLTLALAIVALSSAAPTARQLFSTKGHDDIVCSDTTVTSPKCLICIDKTWNQAACQGINQVNCHKRSERKSCLPDRRQMQLVRSKEHMQRCQLAELPWCWREPVLVCRLLHWRLEGWRFRL